MFLGHAFAVAEPSRDEVAGKLHRQFGLTRASQVEPRAGPRDESHSLEDLAELRSEIDRPPIVG